MVDEWENAQAFRSIERLLNSPELSEEHRAVLIKFDQQNAVERLAPRTREWQLFVLAKFAFWL